MLFKGTVSLLEQVGGHRTSLGWGWKLVIDNRSYRMFQDAATLTVPPCRRATSPRDCKISLSQEI